MKEKFRDVSIVEANGIKTVCYRSSLAVMEESLVNGVPVASGYNTVGYPLNVLSNCASRLNPHNWSEPYCFNVEVDGETVCRRMTLDGFSETEENDGIHAVASFSSGVKKMTVHEHTVMDGTKMFTRYLEIENRSDRPQAVSRIVLHGGGIEQLDLGSVSWQKNEGFGNIYSYGCFDNDECCREGEFSMHQLVPGVTSVDTRFGAGRHRHPFIFLKNNLTGDMFYVQVGWSGGVRFSIDFNAKESYGEALLSYTAELTGHKPLYVLEPGEKLRTPDLHFCAVHGGIDDAVNEGIAHIRKSVLNMPEADGSALLVGAGMGAEHDMSVETSKSFARQMRDMGAEVFIIDAGWYCPPGREMDWYGNNGINRPDPDRYPGESFKELRDYCHSIGMKFALWMEPERIGDKAGIREKHPEWFAEDVYDAKAEGFVDMTNPEACNWVESEIARIVEEYGLDLLRIDYNVGGNEVFAFRDVGTGTEECLALRHFNAVYGMYERLKKRFPDVIFENCASGGARTDLGLMKNFCHTWVSDNQQMPRSIEITNGMTMVLPPERVDRLFAGMGCHRTGELYAHMRNTMLTHMSLNVIAPACLTPNTESMEFVKHSVELYKNKIRPMMPECLVYHHTPDRKTAEEKKYQALEICSPDNSIGFVAVYTLSYVAADEFVVFPKGVSSGKKYSVTLDNSGTEYEIDGKDINANGIRLRINSSLSSELIMYEEKLK